MHPHSFCFHGRLKQYSDCEYERETHWQGVVLGGRLKYLLQRARPCKSLCVSTRGSITGVRLNIIACCHSQVVMLFLVPSASLVWTATQDKRVVCAAQYSCVTYILTLRMYGDAQYQLLRCRPQPYCEWQKTASGQFACALLMKCCS